MTVAVHAELTAAGDRIVLVAGGPAEDVAFASRQLGALTPLIKPTTPKGGLSLPATWPAAVQLAATYGPAWNPGERLQAWTAAEAARRTEPLPDELEGSVPDGLVPRPYQISGANLIARHGRLIIGDEAGTGKTITTILGLKERWGRSFRGDNPPIEPILVVCPASVVDPWVQAFRLWAPHWKAAAWRGTPKQRHALAGAADVYVCSYDTARMDAGDTNPSRAPLVALDPRALVVDEHHLIKNPHAARTAAIRRLARNVTAFVALSGTPITHHPGDLWPTLTCLAPGAWPSRERWVNRYCSVGVADYGEAILGLHPGTEPEFRLTLLGQQRRVAKADVLDQLPPKVYSVRTVSLPPAYRKAYDAMERDMLAELPDGQELSAMDVLSQLTCLSRLACAAADVEITTEVVDDGYGGTVEKQHTHIELKAPSWKVDALVESLQAEDRCHRIGSEIHDSVEIVDVVAADTIDTRVRAVLREKAGQLADLVQDPRIVAELLGGASVTRLKKVS